MTRNATLWITIMLALASLAGCATSPPEPAAATDETAVVGGGAVADPEAAVDDLIVDEVDGSKASREPAQDKCPAGTKEWCVRGLRTERCKCVHDSYGRDVMERLPNSDYQKRL